LYTKISLFTILPLQTDIKLSQVPDDKFSHNMRFQAFLCSLGLSIFCKDRTPENKKVRILFEGLAPTQFNAPVEEVIVIIKNDKFDNKKEVTFKINNVLIEQSQLEMNATRIIAPMSLLDGLHSINFTATSIRGKALALNEAIWVGSNKLQVNLVAGLKPFLKKSNVSLTLGDDFSVTTSVSTSTGVANFTNLPDRTLLALARGSNNQVGSNAVVGGTTPSIDIDMDAFNSPSNIDNNDFKNGTLGWIIPADINTVSVLPHDPHPGPNHPLLQERRLFDFFEEDSITNQDLCITTDGTEGGVSTSRVFKTPKGSTMATIRYRFITSEYPRYFGTQYNDYFRISLRSQMKGSIATEIASMNGLGAAEFDAAGSTRWRDVWLALDTKGDTVAVDVVVANVGDGAYQSTVCIDFVEVWNCKNEYLDAVLGVGFFDAFEAGYFIASESEQAMADSGLTGIYQGPADAFRHCHWNCRMAQEIGLVQAETVGTLHEACNPDADAIDIKMDTNNNNVGRSKASNGDCAISCMEALQNNELTVLNPNAMP
jgi:hypothetical protein